MAGQTDKRAYTVSKIPCITILRCRGNFIWTMYFEGYSLLPEKTLNRMVMSSRTVTHTTTPMPT